MTLLPFLHPYSERSERTRTQNLRPMSAKRQRCPGQSRASSGGDPDSIRFDLYRWETEGGALMAN
jgi:hypothetical protein